MRIREGIPEGLPAIDMRFSQTSEDELGAGLAEIARVPTELRQLRAEVTRMRQEIEALSRTMPPALVTVGEAAKRIGVSSSTLRRHIKLGEIPFVRVGRTIRVDLVQLRPIEDAKVIELAVAARQVSSARVG